MEKQKVIGFSIWHVICAMPESIRQKGCEDALCEDPDLLVAFWLSPNRQQKRMEMN